MDTKYTFGRYSGGVIRVSLANTAEYIIDALASTKNLNVRMIQDLTGTEIDWDKECRLVTIHGDQESAIKAYDGLTGYIRDFMSAIMSGVDYTPTVSASIYGPELARGLCFCLRKPNEEPGNLSPRNSPDAKGAEKIVRTFQLYPAHLSAQEKVVSRAISRGLRCPSKVLVGGMRGFLIDNVTTILDKYREKLPPSERVFIKPEVTLGKNFFLERDIKNYNLTTLKLDIHDFRLMRLGDEIKRVFQRRWVGEWIGKLETLLSTLGYGRLEPPETVMEICLQGERSNGQFYNTVWLASLVPKDGQEVKGLKLLESRIQLKSCYKADILNGGEKLDMIFESSIYKNEHESACQDISRLVTSRLGYAPWWGLVLNRGVKEEYFHPAGILFKRYRKQTKTKWVHGGNVVTLIEEMEADGRTFYTVKVSNKRLEDLLNSRSRIVPFSEILDAVTEYLNACDQISSQFQFVEGVLDHIPAGERCSFGDHGVDKCYAPQAGPKNRESQLVAQALRMCQNIDNNQTPTQKAVRCDVESGAETSDPMTGNINETVEPDCTGSDGPLINFLTDLCGAGSGAFYDIMGAQDSALPNYPPLLPTTPASAGGMATTSLGPGGILAGPALDSGRAALEASRAAFRRSFWETGSGNSPRLPTNSITDGPKWYASSGNIRRTEEIGFADFLHAPWAGGGENAEPAITREPIAIKDDFTANQPAVEELGGPSHGFSSSKGLRGDVQGREKLIGTTHGQSTKVLRSPPEPTGVAEYLEAIRPGRRSGSLPDATVADQARSKDHLSTGYGAESAQGQAGPAGTHSCTEGPSTPLHPSDRSSIDSWMPVSFGEALCELQKEISALNKAGLAGTPSCTERPSTPDHPFDFGMPVGFGEVLCELQKETSALNKAGWAGSPSCTVGSSTPDHPFDRYSAAFGVPTGCGEELCELQNETSALNKAGLAGTPSCTERPSTPDHPFDFGMPVGFGEVLCELQKETPALNKEGLAGTPSCAVGSSTPDHPFDRSSTDFGMPAGFGEELCELEKEISALNKAVGFV